MEKLFLGQPRPTKEYGRICHLHQAVVKRPTTVNHTTR